MEESQVRKAFDARLDKCPYATCQEFLTGIFPQKLIPRLLELSHIRHGTFRYPELKPHNEDLIRACKQTLLTIEDTNGFDNAQVCAGGVRTGEVYPDTLESRHVDGLYLPANSWMWREYAADTTCSGPGLPDIWQGARRQEDPDIYWSILTMNVNF